MVDNILRVNFGKELKIKSRPLYQYDYGQKLKFLDLNLPAAYEVHFSNYEHGTATVTVATSNEVAIPDVYLQTGLNIFVWLYLHAGQNDGETEYMLTIPVIRRAAILDTEPTPQEQSVITQTIAALNSAASTISASSSAAAQAALDAETYRGTTRYYMERTQEYKEAADAAYAQISTAIGSGYITLGSTQLTETQLIGLLKLIEED